MLFLDSRYIVTNITGIFRFIRISIGRIQLYKETCKRFNISLKKIPNEVEPRWNSIHLVLHVGTSYRHVLDAFIFAYKDLDLTIN